MVVDVAGHPDFAFVGKRDDLLSAQLRRACSRQRPEPSSLDELVGVEVTEHRGPCIHVRNGIPANRDEAKSCRIIGI